VARNVANKSAASNGPPPGAAPESLDQVRDILFGSQMRMVDARLQGLESRLQQEQAALRTEFSRNLGELDDALKKGLAQLGERLSAERAKRVEDLKAVASDLRESLKNLEKRHQGLEEAASNSDAELRDHLIKQGAALQADLAKTADRLAAQINGVATALQADKLDTSALAAGLTELAHRLTGNGTTSSRRPARG
jgi:recombinational DNA repair ATPase RecF